MSHSAGRHLSPEEAMPELYEGTICYEHLLGALRELSRTGWVTLIPSHASDWSIVGRARGFMNYDESLLVYASVDDVEASMKEALRKTKGNVAVRIRAVKEHSVHEVSWYEVSWGLDKPTVTQVSALFNPRMEV
jgi:hypothetical protein